MSHHEHDKKHHDKKHQQHQKQSDESFGTNDTGADEDKEWMDGLSDDE